MKRYKKFLTVVESLEDFETDVPYSLKLGIDGYWFLYCSGIEVFSFHDDELSKHQVPDNDNDRLWFALHLYQGYF